MTPEWEDFNKKFGTIHGWVPPEDWQAKVLEPYGLPARGIEHKLYIVLWQIYYIRCRKTVHGLEAIVPADKPEPRAPRAPRENRDPWVDRLPPPRIKKPPAPEPDLSQPYRLTRAIEMNAPSPDEPGARLPRWFHCRPGRLRLEELRGLFLHEFYWLPANDEYLADDFVQDDKLPYRQNLLRKAYHVLYRRLVLGVDEDWLAELSGIDFVDGRVIGFRFPTKNEVVIATKHKRGPKSAEWETFLQDLAPCLSIMHVHDLNEVRGRRWFKPPHYKGGGKVMRVDTYVKLMQYHFSPQPFAKQRKAWGKP